MDENVRELRKLIKKGDTIYTILRHVSRSGMMRHISLFVIKHNEPYCIDFRASEILGLKRAKNEGLKISGCGMDMGFEMVYNLSSRLWTTKEAERHHSIKKDAGYILNQRWI